MNITRELVKFDWFEHNLIISFHHGNSQFIFESWLSDFDVPSGFVEFIQYTFHDVSNFERFIPKHPKGNRFDKTINDFYAKDFSGDYEPEESVVCQNKNSTYIKIILPYLLGTINFSFTRCEALKRIAVEEKNEKGIFICRDITTGEIFDSNSPFEPT